MPSCSGEGEKDAKEDKAQKPNIVYILTDDLGYGDVGCYGQDKIETPNIDELAEEGILFTQHYSGSPVSAPARCVLLTGKHTGHSYIRSNDPLGERGDVWDFEKASKDPGLEGQRPIPGETVTIGEVLQEAGYTTGCVGKWGLGPPMSEGAPNNQGFDFYYGYICQRQAHTYYPLHLWKNDEKDTLDNKLVPPHTELPEEADPYDPESYSRFRLTDYAPDLMIEETMQFLERNKQDPFFMYYATPIPHLPLQAPKRWVEHYVEKFGDEDPYTGDNGYFPSRYP
ncbi:MAG: sulfatase-like hydrolase/transferase, partial [Bacteroidales bacterium]|nr:sulfatase-like hydrolase/transferase [Bacteroidales bacterium]